MPETAAGLTPFHRDFHEDWDTLCGPDCEVVAALAEARALGRAEALAGLECPAAKHHRVRRERAARMLTFDENGAVYGKPEPISDTCTACGHDFAAIDNLEEPHA